MNLLALLPWRAILPVLAALALLAGIWFHGRHVGADGVRAEWQAQQQADREAADAERESNRLRAQAAAKDYESQRAAIAARQPSQEYRYALTARICPPPGALVRDYELGDLPLPGAVLDRLRAAGADY